MERSAYFDVACCPANLARTLASLPGLIYATADSTVFVNLFASSQARIALAGTRVALSQRTNFPWDGDIELRIQPEKTATFTVAVRLPGWSLGRPVSSDLYRFHQSDVPTPTAVVNGAAVHMRIERGFALITRAWETGDVVHLHFPMPVQRVLAHDAVTEDRGRAAFQRGPLVFALEGVDNGADLDRLRVPLDTDVSAAFKADLLGGVVVLTGIGQDADAASRTRPFVAIPYFAWANRASAEMLVWIKHSPQ